VIFVRKTNASRASSPKLLHRSWQQRSLASIWHPCTPMQCPAQVPPLPISRGEGPWLFDDIGRRYFDTSSSWWVNLFGHSDARLNAALKDQLDTLPHVMLAGCTHAPAVEMALKMSHHHWRNRGHQSKRGVASLRQGYHGETLDALAVTDVAVFRNTYEPLLMRSYRVMSPDARQAGPGESAVQIAERAAAELQAAQTRALSFCTSYMANLELLATQLDGCTTPIKLMVTDAVFSMDGSLADLPTMLELAKQFDAWLIIDDANAFGVFGAMEIGYQLSKIQEESMHYEMLKRTGEYPIVGVNTLRNPKRNAVSEKIELARSTDEEKQSQLARLTVFHTTHGAEAPVMLARLPQTVIDNRIVFEVLMDAVRVCSQGQITSTLFEVGGQYRRSMSGRRAPFHQSFTKVNHELA